MNTIRVCGLGFILEFHLKEKYTSIFTVPGAEDCVAVSCIWLDTIKVSLKNFTLVSRLTEVT